MRDAVRAAFYDFNRPMEGDIPWFYQDVKGLVSIGVGILCDPIQLALNLPMVWPGGDPAGRSAIASEWLRIKNLPPDDKGRTAAQLGHLYAKPFTKLRLTEEGLRLTVESKMNVNEQVLRRAFFGWDTWPADAQMATLSMSWAVGPAFWSPQAGRNYWPKLTAALKGCDFRTAAVECFLSEEKTISGLRPRNKANRLLFENAAIVEEKRLDPGALYYPRELARLGPDDETPAEGFRLHELDSDPPPEAA